MTSQLFPEPTRPQGRARFKPIVTITRRCAWCGTRFSFAWFTFDDHSCCGPCAGYSYADVWGDR